MTGNKIVKKIQSFLKDFDKPFVSIIGINEKGERIKYTSKGKANTLDVKKALEILNGEKKGTVTFTTTAVFKEMETLDLEYVTIELKDTKIYELYLPMRINNTDTLEFKRVCNVSRT